MADSGQFTATLRLTVGDLKVVHPITVPSAAVPATEIVPALQGLVNAVVAAAESGKTISCARAAAPAAGNSCRSRTPRRAAGRARRRHAGAASRGRPRALRRRGRGARAGGLSAVLLDPAKHAGKSDRDCSRSDRELSITYFAQRIACPSSRRRAARSMLTGRWSAASIS